MIQRSTLSVTVVKQIGCNLLISNSPHQEEHFGPCGTLRRFASVKPIHSIEDVTIKDGILVVTIILHDKKKRKGL